MPSNQRAVVVLGRIASGKTTLAQKLAKGFSAQSVSASALVVELAAGEDIAVSDRVEMQRYGIDLLANRPEVLTSRLQNEIGKAQDFAIVDGLRGDAVLHALRNQFDSAPLVLFLDAPASVRRERYEQRLAAKDRESFKKADSHPVEQTLIPMRASSDLVIDAAASKREVWRDTVDAIYDRWGLTPGD